MLILSILLMAVAFGLFVYTVLPIAYTQVGELNKKRNQQFLRQMDRTLQEDDVQKAYRIYAIAPIALGGAGFILAPPELRFVGLIAGIVGGLIFPRIWIGGVIKKRRVKFNDQMMDALMIMSSSFRGGLSLVQAFETVVDEMPDPIRYEFSIVLGENKMGVSLDETLNRLYKRMPSPGLQQMITAILLSRETGGNLPAIFSRIVQSIRERKKVEMNLQTLTVQGKLQAVVMTGLPILFIVAVSSSNPGFFDPMLKTDMGHKAMLVCLVLWTLGAISVVKISTFKDV
ncbi:MAG: type II secretion system F family protein [Candidatus Omnitrophica bacterium]|nr:type II secretion system F family protein [Candidatus Omnitrophota bacterium]